MTKAMVSLPEPEQKKLLPQLERTIHSIEQLLLAGLTTASQATHQTLAVTFQEASRLKLLRLGATLRATCDEINRYIKDEPGFSTSRLMFFLNRSWLICRGMQRALQLQDAVALDNLLWNAPTTPVDQVDVVCLGVSKKIAAGSFCAFEFRLRDVKTGRSLSWSTVFPLRAGTEIPAEGYLHLPQKQKFTAALFLERKVVTIHQLLLSQPQYGPARIQLTDTSQVVAGDAYSDWSQWLRWDVPSSLQRLKQHTVSPFDVDVELQEEIAIHPYTLEATDTAIDERKGVSCQNAWR